MIVKSAQQLRDAGYDVSDEEFKSWRVNGFQVYLECLYTTWPWYKKLAWKLGIWKPLINGDKV